MVETKKWYRFDGGPISQWGHATEDQAKAYRDLRSRRYPGATYEEVAGKPEDEGCTIVNVAAMLDAAGIQVTPAPFKPIKPEYIYRKARNERDCIGVATSTVIYIGIKDRSEFDKIGVPVHDTGMQDTGHVLVKQVGEFGNGKPTVIFQYWLVERDYVAERVAEMQRKETAVA